MKPYTYLIKHKPTGLVYYGFRSANKVDPEQDLWNKYFTSSTKVKLLLEETGADSFDVEIRKTFDTQEQAVEWETKVLRRCKVLEDDRWVNQNIAGYVIPTEESNKKISDYWKGKPKSEEQKLKIKHGNQGQKRPWAKDNLPKDVSGANNGMYGKQHSDNTKRKISEANKASGHMLGDNNPMRKVEWTEERKQHMKNIRAKRGPWTEEQKERMASKLRGQKREKRHCPHCDKDIAVGWYNRHGDNCKHAPRS